MPMTATFASCVLIFSNNVAIAFLLCVLDSTGFLVGQLALQDAPRILRQQAVRFGVAALLAQPFDAAPGRARVVGRVRVGGAGMRQPLLDEPLRRFAGARTVRTVEGAEIDHQRRGA